MNKKIIKNLIPVVFALVFAIVFLVNTSIALAYVPGVWDPQPRVSDGSTSWSTQIPLTSTTDAQTAFLASPIVYTKTNTNNTTTNNTTTAKPVTTNRTVTTTRTVNNTSSNTSNNTTVTNPNNLPPVVTSYSAAQNNLGASSYQASNFLPGSFFGWLIVILLIFAVIILVRMISRSRSVATTHSVATH